MDIENIKTCKMSINMLPNKKETALQGNPWSAATISCVGYFDTVGNEVFSRSKLVMVIGLETSVSGDALPAPSRNFT